MSEQELLELLEQLRAEWTPRRCIPEICRRWTSIWIRYWQCWRSVFSPGPGSRGRKPSPRPSSTTIPRPGCCRSPVGKKYTPEHLLVITLIQTLKQSLSLEDVGRLFAACPEFSGEGRYDAAAVHARYEDFERMKLSQEKLAEAIQENMKDCQAEDLFSQVLYLANLSGALSLTALRLIDTLPQPEKPGRGKKQPAAPKSAAGI